MNNWWMNVGAGLLCGLALAITGCGRSQAPAQGQSPMAAQTDKAPRIKTVRPTRENLQRSTTQPAHVDPYEKINVFAKQSGYLDRFGQVAGVNGKMRDVDMGDRVEKDQVLAELRVPEMKKELELKEAVLGQARADVKKFEAELKYRETELTRHEKMVKDRTVEEAVLDEKRLQRDSVRAAIASAQARVEVATRDKEHAEELLKYATIRAPFAGLVTRRLIDTGAFVQSATSGKPEPLFTLARIDRLRIHTDIPETDTGLVKIGQAGTLQVDAVRDRKYKVKVVRFSDALDSATRTMRVELEPDGSMEGLRPGMFGAVTIILQDEKQAMLLPASALRVGDKPAVMVVEDGRARRRGVQIGFNDGIRVQIVGGLAGDEQVIADGKATVTEGQQVDHSK